MSPAALRRDRGARSVPSDDVIIIGGGVIGMAIAEAVAGEGLRTRLIEAEGVGTGASGAAAGMLAPFAEWRADDPMLPRGLASLSRFEALCARLKEETGIDPELEKSGLQSVAFDAEQASVLRDRQTRLEAAAREGGWSIAPDLEWIDGDALRTSDPLLAPDVVGALYSPRESHLRPPLFVRALEASARRLGVAIETGVRALRLNRDRGRVREVETTEGVRSAEHIVLAAGPWTSALLAASGLGDASEAGAAGEGAGPGRPEIEPVRGQILALEGPLPSMRSICWSPDVYLVPKRDGSWIVGATEERVGFDRRVTAEGVSLLLARACRVFPTLAEATFVRAWAGLRPVHRRGRPWIGPLGEWDGLQVAAGHGRNGVLLAPITAQIVRDSILGKDRDPDGIPV